MALTKRGNILENILAAIDALGSVTTVEINSTRALHSVDPTKLPFVNITSSGVYDESGSGVGAEMWQLRVDINIITLDGDTEDIRGDIKEALSADDSRGAYAKNTVYKSDSDIIDIQIPANVSGTRMIYEITYTTQGGKKT